jgi:hypothetical protein
MAFRRDGQSEYDWPVWRVELELTLATAAVGSKGMSKTFAANLGPDATTMVARKWINFPPSLFLGVFNYPFLYQVPFDGGRSFPLGGGKPLAWDARVHDNDMHKQAFFRAAFDMAYTSLSDYAYGVNVPIGRGCWVPGQVESTYCFIRAGWKSSYPGQEIFLYGNFSYGPPFGKALALLATQDISAGIPVGAPGCRLFLNPGAVFFISPPRDLDYRGYCTWGSNPTSTTSPPFLAVPDNPTLHGFRLLGQMAAFDRSLTSLYTTNYVRIRLGYPWQKTKARGLGAGFCYSTTSATAATGNLLNSSSSEHALIVAFSL